LFQPHSGEHTGRALLKGLAFASPFVIGFVLLYAWPILASGYYSLTDFSLFKAP
jgi:multiple sugar transport system permease protein